MEEKDLKVKTKFEETHFELFLKSGDQKLEKKFPNIWLRDNCTCSQCYNKITSEIEIDIGKLSLNPKAKHIFHEKNSLEITWDDDHKSEYNLVDLAKFAFSNELRRETKKNKRVLWNNEIFKNQIKSFTIVDYKKYLTDDKTFKSSLDSIFRHGAVLIKNVPNNPNEIANICNRIGPIQSTFFNSTQCVVTNNLEHPDRAYTNMPLKAHTDSGYFRNTPGLELFHVIQRSKEGGNSLLLDGFYCAELLKKEHPEDYNFLKRVKVQIQFLKKGQYDFKTFESIIKEDELDNELYQIRYNPYDKRILNHLTTTEIERFFRAIQNFSRIIHDPANELWLSLQEDEVIMFDNFRLLHGRSAVTGQRTLVTAYISKDDYQSKLALYGID